MDFEDTQGEAAFRRAVRSWLHDHAEPCHGGHPTMPDHDARLARARRFQAEKAKQGYAAITWPKVIGGYGGSEIEHLIYLEEEAQFDVDSHHYFAIGIHLCIGTIMKCGTDEQRQHFIPPALRGDKIWCQLFSEPGCGSDLAAVSTRAVRDGDDWVISGQKVWTTGGHYSDYGLILTRTDPKVPKHQGLTMFLVDMKDPGIEVQPIKQMSGEAEFNQVFLDNVRIPDGFRVGPLNGGWKVALTTLGLERAVAGTELSFVGWQQFLDIARTTIWHGRPALNDGRMREKISECWLSNFGMRLMAYRNQTALGRGAVPGPEQSMGKLILARQGQQSAIAVMDMLGVRGTMTHETIGGHWKTIERAWYWSAAYRIAGGTDEILRNILAERVLGLPPEVRTDRDVPFKQLAG